MTSGIVFDIKRFSLHDGPGIRTTVFLKGCGLRCWWCHNPESQRPHPELMLRPEFCIRCGACMADCPRQAIAEADGGYVTNSEWCDQCGDCVSACYADGREMVGREMSVAEVIDEIFRDAAFYDEAKGGVTFSGGEPLLQADFLLALLQACKAHDLHTTVDTCGYAPTATLNRVREYVDLFLYDLKLMDEARHRQFTGVSNTLILHNLHLLAEHQHNIVVRIPVIPGVNADDESLQQMAAFLRELPTIERIDLLAYHHLGIEKYERLGRDNPMPPTQPPSESRMAHIQRFFEGCGFQVRIGG